MSIFLRRVALAAVLAAVPTAPAFAGPIGDTGTFAARRAPGFYYGSGGEFSIYSLNGLTNSSYVGSARNISDPDAIALPPSFQTFCLETGETAAALNYFHVGSAAVQGGMGLGGSDQLSQGTAWLYSLFAQGTLSVASTSANPTIGNYFGGVRSQEARYLQKAIWWLEGEDNNTDSMGNPYYAAAVKHFDAGGNKAAAESNASAGQFNVYVLNNFRTAAARDALVDEKKFLKAERAQDFLYYDRPVPDGGTTLMLLGSALLGLGALRRTFGR